MELIRGLGNLRPRHRGCVASIGNFDGVHLGHKAILEQLVEAGRARGLPSAVVTFEPQPLEFFAGQNAPARLTRLREKLMALAETRIERVLVLRFNRSLATLPAQAFIARVLHEGLGIRLLVVGDDFRFGHNGEGNFHMLQEAGASLGFDVVKRDTYAVPGGRVSSSWIRDALANGELHIVRELLGRPYALCGRVCVGRQLGRSIGFPTANLPMRRMASPIQGVYAVRLRGVGASPLPGVANIGRRPTVNGQGVVLEVHVFDFYGELYGRHVCVEFERKIRDEKRFASLDVLKEQIARDAAAAREILAA